MVNGSLKKRRRRGKEKRSPEVEKKATKLLSTSCAGCWVLQDTVWGTATQGTRTRVGKQCTEVRDKGKQIS